MSELVGEFFELILEMVLVSVCVGIVFNVLDLLFLC